MSFIDTLNRFKLVSGLSDEESSKWLPVIKDACDYVKTLAVKENPTEYELKTLDKAAGVNAYYRYVVYTLEEESSFSAGDVSVTYNKDKVQRAKEMWDKELENLGDLVCASHFSFRAVK